MCRSLLLLTCLVGLTFSSSAQITTPASPTRFYLGVGASALSSAPASSYNRLGRIGPSLIAGAQLNPRWALQAGAALNWRKDGDSQSYRPSPSEEPTVYTYNVRSTTLTVPLLARYTFTDPIRPFRGELLGGVTLLHTAAHFTSSSTPAGQLPFLADERSNVTRGSLSLGVAARQELSPRLEVAADGLVNATVTNSFQFSERFFLNLGVSIRYYLSQ
jgi:hypothetical protein